MKCEKMPYDYLWEWEGRTQQSYDTWARSTTGQNPADPFPTDQVVDTARISILSEMASLLQSKFAELGYNATITLIEPETDVQTQAVYKTILRREGNDWIDGTFHHYLHMTAKVHFNTDKPIMASPLDPATIAGLVWIIKQLAVVIAVAIAIIIISEAVSSWVQSFGVTKQTVKYYDPNTGKLIKEEDLTKGAGADYTFWIGLGLVTIVGVTAYALLSGTKKTQRQSSRR